MEDCGAYNRKGDGGIDHQHVFNYDMTATLDVPTTSADTLCAVRSASVVSLFSGCGGLDLGFRGEFEVNGARYERLPFNIVWANDINAAACRTYRRNLSDHVHCGDVWEQMAHMPTNADVVLGGFPCQDISINGKRRGVAGDRSGLYRAMVETVSRIRPKVFVAENVKGLLLPYNKESLALVLSDFRGLGYDVSYALYNAADYGVPQMRQRVFIVGTLPGVPAFIPPAPTHDKTTWMTCKEAIGDLEHLEENESMNHIWSRALKSSDQGGRFIKADRPADTMRAECQRSAMGISSSTTGFHVGFRCAKRRGSNPFPILSALRLRSGRPRGWSGTPFRLFWDGTSPVP